jgi:hypothetical protein
MELETLSFRQNSCGQRIVDANQVSPEQTEQTPDWENKMGQNICIPPAQESQLTVNVPEFLIVSEETKFLLHTVLTNSIFLSELMQVNPSIFYETMTHSLNRRIHLWQLLSWLEVRMREHHVCPNKRQLHIVHMGFKHFTQIHLSCP